MFKEAANNAIKHGDGGPITVNMILNDQLKMQITNTYDTSREKFTGIQGGKGLQNMKRRTHHMHGELQVEHNENTFIITITV